MVNLELGIGSFHSIGLASSRRGFVHALTAQRRRAAAAQHTACHAAHPVMRGAPGRERDFRDMGYITSSKRRRRDLESGVLVISRCDVPHRRSAAPRARRSGASSKGVRA
ncbi:hypothetical protein WMF04_48495 [Sorangium sp. So ce260]|uniref:hypothetical protein n=1 Tax=Sorangium sp. So ce260 TaxID=3133291 RepID=UPI003F6467C3